MHEEAYRRLSERQEHYWWHRARRTMCVALLRRHGVGADCRWIDLGCGPGGNLNLLNIFQPSLSVGVDLSPLALELAAGNAPEATLVRADISRSLPFRDGAFDVGTIFNVLYHDWISSEIAVLTELRRILRPGGLAVFTEPAFSVLARPMDQSGMARRRYRLDEFSELCRSAGLEVIYRNYFTSFGALALLGMKGAGRVAALFGIRAGLNPSPDTKSLKRSVNEALRLAALAEAQAMIRGIKVPIGTTLICLARRPAVTTTSQASPQP
jgi:SAM-dependent methyltransferase